MKLHIAINSLILIFLLVVISCDENPTEPELITDNEKQNIPFDRLSGKIAFRRILDKQPDFYYFMLLDGNQENLEGIAVLDGKVPTNLDLSPDGLNILYSFFSFLGPGGYFHWQLYIMNIDNLGIINISQSNSDDSYGTWSPDGSKIAFWSNRDTQSSIWIADSRLDSIYHLVDVSEASRTRPAWYPDGEHLLISSTDSNAKSILFKFEISTKDSEILLTSEDQYSDVLFKHMDISPDGSKAAFVKAHANNIDEIWILNLSDLQTTNLTTGHADWHPAWSPDGNQILFSRGKHLYVMNEDGSDMNQVTSGKHTNEFPSWVP